MTTPAKLVVTETWKGSRLAALMTHVRLSLHWRRVYMLHCWADGVDDVFNHYTCMRAAGHFGKHDMQPDNEVVVSFT